MPRAPGPGPRSAAAIARALTPDGLALVGAGADRGVALDVLDRAQAGAHARAEVGHRDVALQVDEALSRPRRRHRPTSSPALSGTRRPVAVPTASTVPRCRRPATTRAIRSSKPELPRPVTGRARCRVPAAGTRAGRRSSGRPIGRAAAPAQVEDLGSGSARPPAGRTRCGAARGARVVSSCEHDGARPGYTPTADVGRGRARQHDPGPVVTGEGERRRARRWRARSRSARTCHSPRRRWRARPSCGDQPSAVVVTPSGRRGARPARARGHDPRAASRGARGRQQLAAARLVRGHTAAASSVSAWPTRLSSPATSPSQAASPGERPRVRARRATPRPSPRSDGVAARRSADGADERVRLLGPGGEDAARPAAVDAVANDSHAARQQSEARCHRRSPS